MSPLIQPIHHLAGQLREHGPALLAGMPEPHDELMSLVWGPRFDREHALGLVARQPAEAVVALPALLAAADAFDALRIPAQRRLRDLIRRHRALSLVPQEALDHRNTFASGVDGVTSTAPAIAVRQAQERPDWGMAEEAAQPWSIAPSGNPPGPERGLPM